MSDWIAFAYIGDSPSGKTSRWVVQAKGDPDVVLGEIYWYAPWRKYVFEPKPQCVFEEDCLRQIATYCETETKSHRALRAAAKAAEKEAGV